MSLLVRASELPAAAPKIGLFGGGGAGKTLTSILLGIGIQKLQGKGAPLALVDPEAISDFVRRVCDIEGVPLLVLPSRSFVDMRAGLTEAEAAGCCAFVVDHYDAVFRELTEAQKIALNLQGRNLPYHHREELFRIWDAWVRQFRASPLACIFNGRLAWEWGDDEDDAGDPVKVKLGTKMRGQDAGYEPDLLIELEGIPDKTVRDRRSRSKRGSIRHHAYVLKDRGMRLNGLHFEWKDLNGYKVGDYQAVWKALGSHLSADAVAGMVRGESPTRSSESLFSVPARESTFAEAHRRRTIAIEEIQGALAAIWPGSTNDEKRLKSIVIETIFKSRSWTHIGTLAPEVLEGGVTVMKHFEAAVNDRDQKLDVGNEAKVIDCIQSCVDLEAGRIAAAVL